MKKKLPPCPHRFIFDGLRCSYNWSGSCGYEWEDKCFICFFSDLKWASWKEMEGEKNPSACMLGLPRCYVYGAGDFRNNECFVPAMGKPKILREVMMLIVEKAQKIITDEFDILTGEDAERFMEEMERPPTKKQLEMIKRAKEIYKKIRKKTEKDDE